MSTTLTPTQQIHVARAEQFLGEDLQPPAAFSLGAAVEHIRRLLAIIGDLTGDAS
jgi:hypothetical protein